MDKIPLLERTKIFLINLLKEYLKFIYYLFWIFIDPRKFKRIVNGKIKSILFISGGAIGDIYNILAIINAVLDKYPVNITLLTHEKNRKFVKNPAIYLVSLDEAKKMIDERKIDAVLLLDPGREREIFDRELFFKLLKVPYVISTDSVKMDPRKLARQYFPILANRKVYPVRANGPNSILNLFKLAHLTIDLPKFYFTKEGEKFAHKFLEKNRVSKKDKLIVIHPGAGKIVKALNEGKPPAHLWPEGRWAELIDKILTKKDNKIIITGVKSEEVITKKIYGMIKNKNGVIYAVNKIPDIESLASIVKEAVVTVTPDTSMAHISSHVKTPAVILYSSASPSRVGPLSLKNIDIYHKNKAHDCRRYACKYCYEVHMKSISVDEVYSAVIRLIMQYNNSI